MCRVDCLPSLTQSCRSPGRSWKRIRSRKPVLSTVLRLRRAMTIVLNRTIVPARYKVAAGIAAPGLSARPYFNRYTDDALDLCDVLSSFAGQAKATLYELCKVMGMAGKLGGIDGSEVARNFLQGVPPGA